MLREKYMLLTKSAHMKENPLDEVELNCHDLKCPWRYAVFDVRTRKVSDTTVWATDLFPTMLK
jgi:hypothetical protein